MEMAQLYNYRFGLYCSESMSIMLIISGNNAADDNNRSNINMPIEVHIPLENSFNLDEGNYRGRLQTLSRKPNRCAKGPNEEIRLLFEMNIPSIKNRIPMTGRNFAMSLKGGTELRRFLEGWLGKKFFDANGGKSLDLEALVGREADLVLIHFQQVGYPKPMTFIQSAFPPGSLELTEEPAAKEGKD